MNHNQKPNKCDDKFLPSFILSFETFFYYFIFIIDLLIYFIRYRFQAPVTIQTVSLFINIVFEHLISFI